MMMQIPNSSHLKGDNSEQNGGVRTLSHKPLQKPPIVVYIYADTNRYTRIFTQFNNRRQRAQP